jgi:hypothetical protein
MTVLRSCSEGSTAQSMDSSDAYDSANLGWDHKGQMVHSLLE